MSDYEKIELDFFEPLNMNELIHDSDPMMSNDQ